MTTFRWVRREKGAYEVSSKGDKRFSAFGAIMPDGRSLECHYQCDVKGYQPGGTDWRLGKGKPPKDMTVNLWEAYLSLWRQWANTHPEEMQELRAVVLEHGGVLSDMFAHTPINQARALATLLNEGYGN